MTKVANELSSWSLSCVDLISQEGLFPDVYGGGVQPKPYNLYLISDQHGQTL